MLPIRIGIFGSLIISNYNSFQDAENIRLLPSSIRINYSDMIHQFANHAFIDFWYLIKRILSSIEILCQVISVKYNSTR